MARHSLKEKLLDAGLRVMLRNGYVGSGVREIAAEAGAPQGSFTNHFRSKEAFTAEVLERYFEHTTALVAQALEDPDLSPRQRLISYLDLIIARLGADGFARGCLIGDLSVEATAQSQLLRQRLATIFAQWQAPFADCIAAAQAAGEIDTRFDPSELAEFLLASWEGAILRMKVDRSDAPLERFKTIVFATVFKETKP